MSNTDLKKLSFVPEYGTKGYEIATNAYSTAKSYVPAPLQDRLTKVEESVTSAAAPYITKAQDKGTDILKIVDSQVDKAVQSASQVYQSNSSYLQQQLDKQRQFHQTNLESYKAAREQYLKKVEDSVDFLRANGLTGAAKKAADEVTTAVAEARKLPGALAKQVHDAFERLLTFEPVQKALHTARPAVDAAYSRYENIHGVVVASPSYKRAYDLSQAAIARAQDTYLYAKVKENLYPMVAKYADPAVEQIAASPYYKSLVAHVEPKTA